MKTSVYNEQKVLSIDKQQVQRIVSFILNEYGVACEEVAVYFVTKQKIAELHGEFFDDPSPTDCITFPIDEEMLGEIFICPEVALEYATKHALNSEEEVTLYLVHGLLHLLGYDDIEEKDRRTMRKNEKKCMELIKRHGLGTLCFTKRSFSP